MNADDLRLFLVVVLVLVIEFVKHEAKRIEDEDKYEYDIPPDSFLPAQY